LKIKPLEFEKRMYDYVQGEGRGKDNLTATLPKGRMMKIKVESEKIIKAVKKLDGVEVVLENAEDAREAIRLVLKKPEFSREHHKKLKDVLVTSFQEYKTSAVDYRMVFLLDFLFTEDAALEERVSVIKEIQEYFSKV
jgi:hypothetical protein